jgi:hypothetical protein
LPIAKRREARVAFYQENNNFTNSFNAIKTQMIIIIQAIALLYDEG